MKPYGHHCLLAVAITLSSVLLSATGEASVVSINWQGIGGPGAFERQALTFAPVSVDGFTRLDTSGEHYNLVDTTHGYADALIYIRLADTWQLFARQTGVNGPYHSSFPLDDFVFESLDFSSGPISGINFTNDAAGATNYLNMNSANGTTFFFWINDDSHDMPIPSTFNLLFIGAFGVFLAIQRRTRSLA